MSHKPCREIVLGGKRGVAIVDREDYKRLAKFRWFLSGSGYAIRFIRENGRNRIVAMHREIMGLIEPGTSGRPAGGVTVDHISHKKLDNRKCNLRLCTRSQQGANSRKYQRRYGSTSQYKGVFLDGRWQRWRAMIRYNNKSYHIGNFDTEVEAARAYDRSAREHFGEFAYLNFPDEESAA